MKAAVWYKSGDVRVEDRECEEMKSNELKVRVAWAGICGSDLHEYLEGPITIPDDKPDPLTGKQAPLTMGHEFTGVVEAIGSGVTKYQQGDKVIINPLLTHRNKDPEYDIYDGFNFIGLGQDGGFADYVIVPEKNVYALPKGMTLDEAALAEPSAVAVQAIKEGQLQPGQTVAIFGAGPIGLLTVIAAKAAGASKIVIFDLSESRLEMALQVGATHAVHSGKQNPLEFMKEEEPNGFDVSFEVAGVEVTFNQAIKVTRTRGTVVIISIFPGKVSFRPIDLTNSGVKITSSAAYEPAVFQKTIDMMASGEFDAKDVITNHIELEDIVEKGFEALKHDKTEVKILVALSGER
jgi:(R,R)-butanediol dehydrogenase/meso-butanediol dehydrogenase/diacetyl reductase